ncbi:hypothetical protein RvY_06865-1 [Ramazzottius varieornatus]|nr:hypothetical protein RvY_06865-1 [Ramazzottius varieornatus]
MARHLKMPGLTPGGWLIIKFIIRILEKFNTVTEKLSADKEATIHRVHCYMNGLVRRLESVRDALLKLDFSSFHIENPFDEVILAMDSELSRVLGYVIDDCNPKFDAVYIASTFLHKKLRLTLPQRLSSLASRWLSLKNIEWYEEPSQETLPESTALNANSNPDGIDDLDFFIDASSEVTQQKSSFDLEVQTYVSLPVGSDDNVEDNPEVFWIQNADKFPPLSRLALDILAIPAASSAPERVFSIASAATVGKGNRLAGHNLERKLLCLRNSEYFPDLDD